MRRATILVGLISLMSLPAQAQVFSSGSTGADGPLDLTSGNRVVQLPESGILNYTTVNIPAGKTLTFKLNSRNTSVILLTQGTVTVAGTINTSAGGRTPGPGGFYGGAPNLNGGAGPNLPGFGPGGGPQADGSRHGRWIGPLSLVPIIGGSGGSGGSQCTFVGQSPYGGGGGGAIVIASSQSITLPFGSLIVANGSGVECPFGGAGGGSGGAIRLVANSINVAGTLSATGADGFGSTAAGNHGVIHIEAPPGALAFTGTSNPPVGLSAINPTIVPTSSPSLVIVSVGGFPVPSGSGQRFDTYDMLLPNQLTDPISVVVQASNIPVGTQVSIGVVNGSPGATTTASALQGTLASSTATPTISNLTRTAVTYLLASATFDPPQALAPLNQKGANHVEKVRVESLVGAKPKFVFLRKDGSVISQERLLPQFLAQFEQ